MSKYQLENSPVYLDGSDIPINKLEIEDPELLHEIENKLLIQAYEKFTNELNEETKFDETYLIDLHKKTFESLYDFAGVYRSQNMSKGDSQFCLAEYLQSESKRIFLELENDKYLTIYKDKKEFAKKLAYFKCELIALHPFYELNGRITRMFFDLIAVYNGYDYIDYSSTTTDEYIQASIECVQFADCVSMEKIIFNGLKK